MSDRCMKGPDRIYSFGRNKFGWARLTIERYGWRSWGACSGSRGVSCQPTPIHALWRLYQWKKIPLRPKED